MAAPCFSAAATEIHSGGFLVSCVFGIFMLPLPFCKLSLTFLALIVGDDVRQKTAGDSLNGVLWNIGMIDELFLSAHEIASCKDSEYFCVK